MKLEYLNTVFVLSDFPEKHGIQYSDQWREIT